MNVNEDNIITLDFETYYDKDYTLSKLSVSEYVRDPRFHAHCVGIKVGKQPTAVYSGEEIPKAIAAIDWPKHPLLCHNVAFDGFILSQQYGVVPGMYLDTLGMSRALHGHVVRHDLNSLAKRYGLKGKVRAKALSDTKGLLTLPEEQMTALKAYCADDVDDTYELFWHLVGQMPVKELSLIHTTAQMFCDPRLLVDLERAQKALDVEVAAKVAATMLASASPKELMSNDRFAEMLRALGYEPPTKISPTTGKKVYAFAKTDKDFQELLEHSDERVVRLAEARLKVKSTINETRAARLIQAGIDGARLPVLLNYCGAHTTRWTGGNKMNLQNLPRGGELRKSILAPPGYVLAVADSAQIEARVTAWLAGHEKLLEAFRERRDVYSEFATKAYGYKVDRKKYVVDPATGEKTYPQFQEGFVGKTCVLGLGFGMGWMKLLATLEKDKVIIDANMAQKLVNTYRSVNSDIVKLWGDMNYILAKMAQGNHGTYKCLKYDKDGILLPNGLKLHYPGLQVDAVFKDDEIAHFESGSYKTYKGTANIYGGLLTENVVQALARAVVAEQMHKITAKYRAVMMTHDEVVALIPQSEADSGLDFMLKTMCTPPDWAPDLPVFAEGGYDVCYSK